MNGRDMMPACARIAAADPAMADRMWNTTTAVSYTHLTLPTKA